MDDRCLLFWCTPLPRVLLHLSDHTFRMKRKGKNTQKAGSHAGDSNLGKDRGNGRYKQTETYPCVATLKGHKEVIVAVRIGRDGSRLASASGDGTARAWDVETGEQEAEFDHQGHGVNDVAYSWDGKILATACDDTVVRIWDPRAPERGSVVRQLQGHTHHVMSCCFSASGEILATAGFDETIRLWCMHTGKMIRVIPAHSDPVVSLDFSSDLSRPVLASASLDGICRLWSTSTGECHRSIVNSENPLPPLTFAKFTPNNQYVLVGSLGGKLRLWDFDHKHEPGTNVKPCPTVKKTYEGHKNDKFALQASFLVNEPSDRKYVVCGSEDHSVYFWDLNSRKVVRVLEGKVSSDAAGDGHCDVVHAVDASIHQPLVATAGGSNDCTVKLWKYTST